MWNPTKLPGGAKWIGDRRRPTNGEPPCPYLKRSFARPGLVRRELTLTPTIFSVSGGKHEIR